MGRMTASSRSPNRRCLGPEPPRLNVPLNQNTFSRLWILVRFFNTSNWSWGGAGVRPCFRYSAVASWVLVAVWLAQFAFNTLSRFTNAMVRGNGPQQVRRQENNTEPRNVPGNRNRDANGVELQSPGSRYSAHPGLRSRKRVPPNPKGVLHPTLVVLGDQCLAGERDGVLTIQRGEAMGLAPSGNSENRGKTWVAKVPAAIFSQPLRVRDDLLELRVPRSRGMSKRPRSPRSNRGTNKTSMSRTRLSNSGWQKPSSS